VSPDGTGDGSRNNPAEIRNAFDNLSTDGSHLRLATGIYNIDTVLDISNHNMIIEGGFEMNNNWVKSSDALATIIKRSNLNITGTERQMRLVALSAIEVNNLHVQNLKIEVADAPLTSTYGVSTYGLYVNDCTDYKFVRIYVEGGKASDGTEDLIQGVNGTNGYDGNIGQEDNGGSGGRFASPQSSTNVPSGGFESTSDQTSTFANASQNLDNNTSSVWQSFTPNKDGIISTIRVKLNDPDNIANLKIFKGEGTDGPLLYDEMHDLSEDNSWENEIFELTKRVDLKDGEIYTFHIDSTQYRWGTGQYSGGSANGTDKDLDFSIKGYPKADDGQTFGPEEFTNYSGANQYMQADIDFWSSQNQDDVDTWQSFKPINSGDLVKIELRHNCVSAPYEFTFKFYQGADTTGTLLFEQEYLFNDCNIFFQLTLSEGISIIQDSLYTIALLGDFEWRRSQIDQPDFPNGGGGDHSLRIYLDNGVSRIGGAGGGGGGPAYDSEEDNPERAGGNGGKGFQTISNPDYEGNGAYPFMEDLQSLIDGEDGSPGANGQDGTPASDGMYDDYYICGTKGGIGKYGIGGEGGEGGGGPIAVPDCTFCGIPEFRGGSGGGSGGEGGSGGNGGYSGGSSFGIYIVNDTLGGEFINCYASSSDFGLGGDGLSGGTGGSGGIGALGLAQSGDFADAIFYAGKGGNGGNGGNGGIGGIGDDGESLDVYYNGTGLIAADYSDSLAFIRPIIKIEEPYFINLRYAMESDSTGDWEVGGSTFLDKNNIHLAITDINTTAILLDTFEYVDFLFLKDSLTCPTTSTIYVDAASNGANTGESWTDAYTSFGTALEVAHSCPNPTDIYIAKGVYKPENRTSLKSNEFKTFKITKNLKIYGGFEGIETSPDERPTANGLLDPLFATVLSGDLEGNDLDSNGDGIIELPSDIVDNGPGDNAFHVMVTENLDSTFLLDGLTFTAGKPDGAVAQYFYETNGGGIFNLGADTITSFIALNQCTFIGNSANGRGGAILNYGNTNATYDLCQFISNSSGTHGGAIYNNCEISGYESSQQIIKCTFKGNNCLTFGGAINNNAKYGTITTDIQQSLFYGNASNFGSAVQDFSLVNGINTTYTNCTLSENDGPAINLNGSNTVINNSIIYNNDTIGNPQIFALGTESFFTINNSNIEGSLPTGTIANNVITSNPLFLDTVPDAVGFPHILGDYHLKASSPAINYGDNALYSSITTDSTDISGNSRFELGSKITPGTMADIDLGPYECSVQVTFESSKDSSDAFIYFTTIVPRNDCDCFDVQGTTSGKIIYEIKNGNTTINNGGLGLSFFPSTVGNIFYDTLSIDEVGPDIDNDYTFTLSKLGPGTVNCSNYDSGSTISFQLPEITSISNGVKPDSVHLQWINKSNMTSGFRVYRNDTLIHTMTASNQRDLAYNFVDVFSFGPSSFVNGSMDTYKIETVSNLYQTLNGTPYMPQTVESIGSSYDINLQATDNTHPDKVVLTWNDVSAFAESLRIIKDSVIIAVLPATATSFEDLNPIFGQVENYSIELIRDLDAKVASYDSGSTLPNGLISGKVLTVSEKFPVANAQLKLLWIADGGEIPTDSILTTSAFDGSYSFADLFYTTSRDYTLKVSLNENVFIDTIKNISLSLADFNHDDVNFFMDFSTTKDSIALDILTAFTVTPLSTEDKILLDWDFQKSANDTTYFNLYRESSLVYQTNDAVLPSGPQSLSFEDLTGIPNSPYSYTLHAYRLQDSVSMDTLISILDTFPVVAPAINFVGNLTANGATDLTWSHTSSNFNAFRLYRLYTTPELIYEGEDTAYSDFEGRPGEITKYAVTSFRTVGGIDYESIATDTATVTYPMLTPINITSLIPPNEDKVNIEFTVPAIYTSDYNYDGVFIIRSLNGTDTVLATKSKILLPASTQVVYEDRSGIPDQDYTYSVHPYKISNGISYSLLTNPSINVTFPGVSIPEGLIATSNIGKITLDWDSPHSSDNYDEFVVYKSTNLDSIGSLAYQVKNSFVDYTYNPPVTTNMDYGVATKRIVEGQIYYSDTIILTANPPIQDGNVATLLENFTASRNISNHIKLCWEWTSNSVQSPFVIRKEGLIIDTLDFTMRTYYDYNAEIGTDIEYSIEALGFPGSPLNYQEVFALGFVPNFRTLSGRVYKQEIFSGIPNARIDLNIIENSQNKYQSFTETDASGYYSFIDIPYNSSGMNNELIVTATSENSSFILNPQSLIIDSSDINSFFTLDFIDTLNSEIPYFEISPIESITAIANPAEMNIQVSWSPENGNYTGFELYKGSVLIKEYIKGEQTTYVDTSGVPGILAIYSVRSYIDTGNERIYSEFGNVGSNFPNLEPVENLTIEFDQINNTAVIQWSHPFNNHNHYVITRNGVPFSLVFTDEELRVIDSTGIPGSPYLYTITAVKNPFSSDPRSVSSNYPNPSSILGFDLTSPTDGQGNSKNHLLLEWEYGDQAADLFLINRFTLNLPDLNTKYNEEVIVRLDGDSRMHMDFTGLPGTQYFYEVIPIIVRNGIEYSAERDVSLSETELYPVLSPPYTFNANQIFEKGRIEMEYVYAYEGIDGIHLYRNDSLFYDLPDTTTSFTLLKGPFADVDGIPNTVYSYKARAYTTRKDSVFHSDFDTIILSYPIPPAPSNFQASDGLYANRVELTWDYDEESPIENFRLEYKDGPNAWLLADTLDKGQRNFTYIFDSQVEDYKPFNFRISAYNQTIASDTVYDAGSQYSGRIVSSALDSLEQLGISVDIDKQGDGTWAVAGSDGDGFALYRQYDDGSWIVDTVFTTDFMDVDTSDMFGRFVKISDKHLVVSAYAQDTSKGALYTFMRNGNDWSFLEKLTDPNPVNNEKYGFTLDVYDRPSEIQDFLVVGAKSETPNQAIKYVYRFNGATWTSFLDTISVVINAGINEDKIDCAVSDTRLAISVPRGAENPSTGHYVSDIRRYDYNEALTTFEYVDESGQTTCTDLDVDGLFVANGRPWNGGAVGYNNFPTTPGIGCQEFGDIPSSNIGPFGHNVGIKGDRLIAGYLNQDYLKPLLISTTSSTCSYLSQIVDNPGDESQSFGRAVALSDNYYMIGSPGFDGNNGKVNFVPIYTVNPPLNLMADDNVPGNINITWTLPTGSITGYEVYVDGDFQAQVTGGATSYIYTEAIPGKVYIFSVRTYVDVPGGLPRYSTSSADEGSKAANGSISGSLTTFTGNVSVEGASVVATSKVDGEYYNYSASTNSAGVYVFNDIYYGGSSEIQITCTYLDHDIKTQISNEDTLNVLLTTLINSVLNQNFKDKTAYAISGNLTHKNIPNCFLDSIIMTKVITVNGMSTEETTYTDEEGNYAFTYEPNTPNIEEVKLQFPEYKIMGSDSIFFDFTSSTDETLFQFDAEGFPYIDFPLSSGVILEKDIKVDFKDQTVYDVYLNMINACGGALGSDIWTLRARSLDGCYEAVHSIDAALTNMISLPPKDMTLTLIDVDNKASTNLVMLEYFVNNPIAVNLLEFHTETARFLTPTELIDQLTFDIEFHKPPVVNPDFTFDNTLNFMCDDFNRGAIVQSGDNYTIPISVTENFGIPCIVTSGYLKITNAAARNTQPQIIFYDEAQGKFPDYKFVGGFPNPVVPHAWNLRIDYYSDADLFQAAYSKAIYVEGSIALPGNGILNDASAGEDVVPLPLYVLRDPPGDGSYSEIISGYETTKSFKFDKSIGGSAGAYHNTEVVIGSLGFGVGLDFSMGTYDRDSRELSLTSKILTTIRTAGEITDGTADDAEKLVGRGASIIVGTGVAMQYGLVNEYVVSGCDSITEFRKLGYTPVALKTRWSYTVQFIEGLIEGYNRDIQSIQAGTLNLFDEASKPISQEVAEAKISVLRDNWLKIIEYYDEDTNPLYYIRYTDFTDDVFPQHGLNGNNTLNIDANRWRMEFNTYMNGFEGELLDSTKIERYDNAATAIKQLMNAAQALEDNNGAIQDEEAYIQQVTNDWEFTTARFNDPNFVNEVMASTETFSGGVDLTIEKTQINSLKKSSSINIFTDTKFNIGAVIDADLTTFLGLGGGVIKKVFSVKSSFGLQGSYNYSSDETKTDDTTSTSSVIIHFNDDDDDNEFTVNVLESIDLNHTPSFQTVGGSSSCPYEEGTLSIDKPKIQVLDPNPAKEASLSYQDPDEPAVFDITITNTSELGIARNLEVFLINSSNPNGAIVKVGGDIISDNPRLYEDEPFNVPLELELTVERNQAFDYENLLIGVRPDCLGGNVEDTIKLSVFFQSPCSPISIVNPGNNWLINSTEKELIVGMRDYESSTPNFEGITLQYRKLGAGTTGFENGWKSIPYSNIQETGVINNPVSPQELEDYNIANYLPGAIPTYYMTWQPDEGNSSTFTDGSYELRTVATCKEGDISTFTYSNIVSGLMDRARLQLFGLPQPSDGIWIPGDEISVSFNKNIDCVLFNDQSYLDTYMKAFVEGVEVTNANFVCFNNQIQITVPDMSIYDGQIMTVSVDSIADVNGNLAFDIDGVTRKIEWEFLITTSKAYWEQDEIIVELYEGETVSIEAGLRNTELQTSLTGLDINRTTNSAPWLAINPDFNFSINPGAVKPINLTFTGLTEGVSYDTLTVGNLPGNGAVPKLPIKLITKKLPPYPPDWEVDGNLYPNSMTMITNYKYGSDGSFSVDTMDQVTVWIDNTIRGLARIERVGSESHVAYVTVYGNIGDEGKQLEYRVWDASDDKEYDAYIEIDSVFYTNNDFIGSTGNPRALVVDTLKDLARYIHLNDGYTWISLNTIQPDMSVEKIFENVDSLTPEDRILSQFGFAEYFNDTIGWVQDTIVGIDSLKTNQTYMVYLDNGPDSIRISGYDAPQYSLFLEEGANWVGYPSQVPLLLEDAIGVDDLTDVYQLRSKDEARITDTMSLWTDGTLTTMVPNEGYKLILGDIKLVTIPDSIPFSEFLIDESINAKIIAGDPYDETTWVINVDDYNFLDVIPVVGKAVSGGTTILADGQKKVAAFIGNDLRGVGEILSLTELNENLFTIFIGKDEIDGNATVKFFYFDGTAVTDSLSLSLNNLLENGTGNGKYTYLDPLIFQVCKEHLVLTTDDSPLIGTYRSSLSITVGDNVEVNPGDSVILSSPLVKVSALFNPKFNAQVRIIPDGCN